MKWVLSAKQLIDKKTKTKKKTIKLNNNERENDKSGNKYQAKN